jgi:replicative DNA helicase
VAREVIDGGEFYRKEHRLIFAAMCRLYEQTTRPSTRSRWARSSRRTARSREAGGMDYLIDLQAMVATAANVTYHAGSCARRRAARADPRLGHHRRRGVRGGGEAAEILDRAQHRIYAIGEQPQRRLRGPREVVPATFKSIEEAFQSKSDVTGLRTGFNARWTSTPAGLQKGDLIILAARPSMGKTSSR